MKTKLLDLEAAVKDSRPMDNGESQRKPCSVVIWNLKRGHNETEGINSIAKNKVVSLVRDGLKLKDVRVTSAERKQSRGDNPGVVIATLESHEQVAKLFEAKKHLKQTNEYRSVYIDPYLTQNELSTQASLRTLLKEIGKSDVYYVHGSKVFPSTGRRSHDQRGEHTGRTGQRSPRSHGSRSGRSQRSRSHGRSDESSRRGQRLRSGRSGRSSSIDRSADGSADRSHGRLPWTPGRAGRERRDQRLRNRRSSSNDRSADGSADRSHGRLRGTPGRAERERRGQSLDRSGRYVSGASRDNGGRRDTINGRFGQNSNGSVRPNSSSRGHSN